MNEPKRKRPCYFEVERWVPFANQEEGENEGQWKLITGNGLFHCWGNEAQAHGDELHTEAVGIVEDETGQCHTVNPNHIKFLDK